MKKKSQDNNQKRAAIYCRVSTIMQGEAEYSSLNAQEDQLISYCKGKGWKVVKIYKDIKSGKDLERDEIQQLLKDAEEKLFDIVVATKIDRFSRSIIDFYDFSKRLSELGVDISSATQPIDTSHSAGKLMLDIFLAFAQFERNIISERTKEGMNARARKGFYTGGHLVLGYENHSGMLRVVESEKEIVIKIFNYYLQEPSTNTVAKRLNSEGYKTKSQTTRNGKSKGGKSFSKADILRTLKNKIYIGKMIWKGEEFSGIHEPIISENIFTKVQDRLKESRTDFQVTKVTKSPLTLLGITKCGLCGSQLTTSSTKGGKHYYYKCSKKAHNTSDHCNAKDLPAEILESCISDLIYSMVNESEFLTAIHDQISSNGKSELDSIDLELKNLKGNRTKLESENRNLLNAIKNYEGFHNLDSIGVELQKIELSITSVSQKINLLEVQRNLLTQKTIKKSDLRQILADYIHIHSQLSIEEKSRLNQLLFSEITSFFNKNDKDGKIVIKIRGDGKLEKSWNQIKNANQLTPVRTSDVLGSANTIPTQKKIGLNCLFLSQNQQMVDSN